MAHIAGLLLIDAPASALNNAGAEAGARTDNTAAVKYIRSRNGDLFPYVSAQAFRYWLRQTLEGTHIGGWVSAPVFREQKVAYADANPLRYWDDDLLGYMRAPSKKTAAREARESDPRRADETPTSEAITRISPFKVSTLVSIAPVNITTDFGVMARQEGDPVPFEHQFYRTTLKGLLSLDLASAGTFSYINRSGYRNLDEVRRQAAEATPGIEHLVAEKAYRLPRQERTRRLAALLEGLSRLEGGAKQTLHYTDVAPSLVIAVVLRGGNNPLLHAIGADNRGQPLVRIEALREILAVEKDQLLSPLYIGWVPGYLEEQRQSLAEALAADGTEHVINHPRRVLQQLAVDMAGERGAEWLG
jgi:CRISPR-associated protein Cst2